MSLEDMDHLEGLRGKSHAAQLRAENERLHEQLAGLERDKAVFDEFVRLNPTSLAAQIRTLRSQLAAAQKERDSQRDLKNDVHVECFNLEQQLAAAQSRIAELEGVIEAIRFTASGDGSEFSNATALRTIHKTACDILATGDTQ